MSRVAVIAHGSAAVQAACLLATRQRSAGDWVQMTGYFDPPPALAGYKVEIERDALLGIAIAYRFVPVTQ